jgi:hypothetical protein
LLSGIPVLIVALLPAQSLPSGVRLDPVVGLHPSAIGRAGDKVHIVGLDNSYAQVLRYARSLDGGRTWPGGLQALGYTGRAVSLAVDGDHVFVALDAATCSLLSSFDGGAHWQPPVSLPFAYGSMQVQANGLDVNVFSNVSIQLVHSGDGGLSWSAPVNLAIGLPGASAGDGSLQVVRDGSEIHLFWIHATPALYLAHQVSMDGGATWLPAAQSIANAPLVGAAMGAGCLLVQAGSTLWRSTNHGATWTPVPGHGFAFPIALAMDGSNVLAVERAPTWWPTVPLRMATSNDAGMTWSVSAATIATLPWERVEADVAGTAMFVRLYGGSGDLHQSDDFGSTWRQLDGSATEAFLVGPDGGIALTFTSGLSTGLWAWVVEGHTGTSSSGGVDPTLTGHGLVGLGRTFQLDLANALGGSYAAYVLNLGAFVLLPTSGQPGLPGDGAASLPIAVPLDPTLLGLRLLSYCMVYDPGAPGSIRYTNARESWVR